MSLNVKGDRKIAGNATQTTLFYTTLIKLEISQWDRDCETGYHNQTCAQVNFRMFSLCQCGMLVSFHNPENIPVGNLAKLNCPRYK